MGRVKDLLMEEERKWDLLKEYLEDLRVVDDETRGKGSTNIDGFAWKTRTNGWKENWSMT